MCGIFGAICDDALSDTLKGLKLLEYRGYDSAGVAIKTQHNQLQLTKRVGRVSNVIDATQGLPKVQFAVGHTRWATHGEVCERNAHPFLSQDGRFALVHNGILDNYIQLREQLTQNGVNFVSDTDSEVAVQLLMTKAPLYDDIKDALTDTARMLHGSFAIAVLDSNTDSLYLLRRGSPLYIGISNSGNYLSSDVNTLRYFCSRVGVLEENAFCELNSKGATQYSIDDGRVLPIHYINVKTKQLDKDSQGNAMLSEIAEIPHALQKTFDYLTTTAICPDKSMANNIQRIYLIGCGTAYHSCLIGAQYIRRFCNVTVEAVLASEWWYSYYKADSNTLVVAVTQSGETADTLNAARECKRQGATVYAVTNVEGSTVTFVADKVILTQAENERAVASTKAYACQVLALTIFALQFAETKGLIASEQVADYKADFYALPRAVGSVLAEGDKDIDRVANTLSQSKAVYFIGRGTDYFTAREGSLKLKEVSYIHSEAYASGELKHGTLAMMEKGVTVVGIACDSEVMSRHKATVSEITSRGADVITVTPYCTPNECDTLVIPIVNAIYYPILSVVPLQLLAYKCAVLRGCDADKPRNLAKSVTVE